MARCTLCGGKLADGRCTECGLDNRKNDKRYRLNVHNEKEMHFHSGTCEDHLNKESSGAFGEAYSADKKKLIKKQKERRGAGTVKKKPKFARLLAVIVFLSVAAELVGVFLPVITREIRSFVNGRKGETPDEGFDADDSSLKPEEIDWKAQDGDYYEKELTRGVYAVGYEIPAGRYQIFCEEGTAWVTWWGENENSDWICLYSKQAQEEYGEFLEDDVYYELSGEIELSEKSVVYVEECEKSVWLRGIADGEVSAREPQELEEAVLWDGMTAGSDFESGIYDLAIGEMPEDEYCSVSVKVVSEDGSQMRIYFNNEMTEFRHMPLQDGNTVYLETYDGTAIPEIRMTPSW